MRHVCRVEAGTSDGEDAGGLVGPLLLKLSRAGEPAEVDRCALLGPLLGPKCLFNLCDYVNSINLLTKMLTRPVTVNF